jgi:hypothetical protein
VIEVHLMWRKSPTAVGAWSLAKTPKQGQGQVLPGANPPDLAITIPRVVGGIRRPLIPMRRHVFIIERAFGSSGYTLASILDLVDDRSSPSVNLVERGQ